MTSATSISNSQPAPQPASQNGDQTHTSHRTVTAPTFASNPQSVPQNGNRANVSSVNAANPRASSQSNPVHISHATRNLVTNRQTGNSPPDNFEDSDSEEGSRPRLNTLASLSRGIVTTSPAKRQKEFTILLVGETGVGKTAILSLFYNILSGHGPDQYTPAYESENEVGGSQASSQTRSARLYEFTSLNGFKLRILDTPGLADTRGLEQDEKHKQSIAKEIQRNVVTVNAVLILANGTVPRLGAATDYALTTLSAIFPRTLVDNIGIVFTNVVSPLSWNFELKSLPVELQRGKWFLIDNPVAQKKKLDQLQSDVANRKLLKALRKNMVDGHHKALDVVGDMLDWIDDLQPQATKDILHLFNQSRDIDHNIGNALQRINDNMQMKQELLFILQEIEDADVDLNTYRNFKQAINRRVSVQKSTDRHNTCCVFPNCKSNCHIKCGLDFTLAPEELTGCMAFDNQNNCNKCGHGHMDHRHYHSIWDYEEQTEEAIDFEAQAKFHSAGNRKTEKKRVADQVGAKIAECEKDIEAAMTTISDLAQSYSELALGGSFVGLVEKSIRLLETNLESLRKKPTSDRNTIQTVEKSLEKMREKHELLKKMAASDSRRVARPNILQNAAGAIQHVAGAVSRYVRS